MKITAVRHYTVHPGWRKHLIFVKVETDAGIHGWGEAYSQYDRDQPVLEHIKATRRSFEAARTTSDSMVRAG